MEYYLAIDIGASSGRHILGSLQNGILKTEEVYRFQNRMEEKEGRKYWDTDRLFSEILNGMKRCKEIGKIPCSVGIDTWAVDFVLLDEKGERVGPCVAYRDPWTVGMEEEVYKTIPEEELYRRTGIQRAVFNTVYQLTALKRKEACRMEKAEVMMMLPDYFSFLLTGVKKQEYTNATSTGLVRAGEKEWDADLIAKLGFPRRLFLPIAEAGSFRGNLKEEIIARIGYDCKVVAVASHDTASAVMGVPALSEDVLYISSGTWSLVGTETKKPNCSSLAYRLNFTNEGGFGFRNRLIKNVMGLWMIQSVKKELEEGREGLKTEEGNFSYEALCEAAEKVENDALIDVGQMRFLSPESMIREVRAACRETGQDMPESPGELARVIYRSLAASYRSCIRELEELTGKRLSCIHIVGGGSKAKYLNRLTAKMTGIQVIAGPTEASAIGNIGAQLLHDGSLSSLEAFRGIVKASFPTESYTG